MATADGFGNINLRLPSEVEAKIKDYMDNAPPLVQRDIREASRTLIGKNRSSDTLLFLDWAISQTLAGNEPRTTPRFGSAIEETVKTIMDANNAAYDADPDAWWNLTAIGTTLLRDKGHNPTSVRKWVDQNAELLDSHHKSVGIDDAPNHNRKAGKARKTMGI